MYYIFNTRIFVLNSAPEKYKYIENTSKIHLRGTRGEKYISRYGAPISPRGTTNPAAHVLHTRTARTSRPYPQPEHVSAGSVCEFERGWTNFDLVRAPGAPKSGPKRHHAR